MILLSRTLLYYNMDNRKEKKVFHTTIYHIFFFKFYNGIDTFTVE